MSQIVQLLDGPDARVRTVAAYCMQYFGEESVVALERLKTLLADDDVAVREAAAWAISSL